MATTYTDAQKADAVALYVEHGLAEAHHRTGIPRSNLRRWVQSAGLSPQELTNLASDKMAAAVKSRAVDMEAKRVALRGELLETAEYCTRHARDTDTGRDAQGWMTAGAIALDKVRLELGEVTDRTEHRTVDQVTAEVERLAAEMTRADEAQPVADS